MFKAKLIADPSFSFFRKHTNAVHIIHFAINMTIINMFLNKSIDWYLLILAIPVYVFSFYILFKLGRKIMNSLQDRQIELHSDSIKIINKSSIVDFEIPMSCIERINIQKEYKYEESIGREIIKHLKGIANFHFIQVYYSGQWHTLRFMLDSHYMESKLFTIIQHWESMGIPLVYSEEPIKGNSVKSELETVV